MADLRDVRITVRGAGELGSAVAVHLPSREPTGSCWWSRPFPKAVRRHVCFSEAVFEHAKTVEGVTARFVMLLSDIDRIHELGDLAVTTQSLPELLAAWPPDVYVEAAMLRSNWGLDRELAPIVIALGPGFQAGRDCHAVVETDARPEARTRPLGRAVAGRRRHRPRSWVSPGSA